MGTPRFSIFYMKITLPRLIGLAQTAWPYLQLQRFGLAALFSILPGLSRCSFRQDLSSLSTAKNGPDYKLPSTWSAGKSPLTS
jgi:hypothetical protein